MLKSNEIGLWSAVATGVGAMIGAGIFSLVGIAVEIAGGYAFFSFLIAGLIALLTAYSFSQLSRQFPTKDGPVTFLIEGFGSGVLSGGLYLLMWTGYMFVTSLYAVAFAHYTLSLFPNAAFNLWYHLLISTVVVLFVGLNLVGTKTVANTETFLVSAKILILFIFSLIGLYLIKPCKFTLTTGSASVADILVAAGLVFMAYEGFGLIAHTAQDKKQPSLNLKRAFFISLFIVITIYLLIVVVVIGNLDINVILSAREYVPAKAAEPFMGQLGFKIMALAAMFSTASAINATLYGPVKMVHETAQERQLPSILCKRVLNKEEGLAFIVTGLAVLFFANLFPLKSIAEL